MHFVEDHKRHDVLIGEYKAALEVEDDGVTDKLNRLRNALLHHFQEEELLYDAYMNRSQKLDDLIDTIRGQHRQMQDILDESYDDLDFDPARIDDLLALLATHRELEEQKLYPEFDRVVTEAERKSIIEDLNNSRAKY